MALPVETPGQVAHRALGVVGIIEFQGLARRRHHEIERPPTEPIVAHRRRPAGQGQLVAVARADPNQRTVATDM